MPTSQKLTIAALLIATLVVGSFVYNRTKVSPEAQEFQDSADEIERMLPQN